MLRMGWSPGQCLGKGSENILEPISAVGQKTKLGLGYNNDLDLENNETENMDLIIKRTARSLGSLAKSKETALNTYGLASIFEDVDYEEEGTCDLPTLPEVLVQIGNSPFKCLIDTGSQVTAIARDTYEEIQRLHCKISVLPITNIQLKGAIGQRSAKINRLALIPLSFEGQIINTPCLIVEKLIRPLILGYNWLEDNKVTICCENPAKIIIGTLQGKTVSVNSSGIRQKIITMDKEQGGGVCQAMEVSDVTLREIDVETYVQALDINEEEKFELLEVLKKRRRVFSSISGCTHLYEHKIKMLDETPFVKYPYPVPFSFRAKVEEKITELEHQGIIKRAATPYASPLTYTVKKDGSVRILLDARELNSKMEGETEKPPIISEVLQQFHGVKFISTLDLNNAYFQIKLHKDSVKYTGFVFNNKSYVYLRLPQGLKTAVAGFSRAMDMVLGNELRAFCANYLDDVCCYSKKDIQEHMGHLDRVLEKFETAGMTCNLSKCQFLRQRVKMLGHIISPEGIEMDEEKVKAIKEFPVPKKIKHLRAFLGLCNYYRRFINKYSRTIKPLCELLKREVRWSWGEEQQRVFDEVKNLFLESVILKYPDPEKTYYLQTDSSGYALGGCLYQLDSDGNHHVISFCSKGFVEAERKWTVSEQELWAIIYCLKKFETYVRGAKLVIRTDHHSLTFLRSWKLHCNRIIRWLIFLNQFDYCIEYVTGKENIAADVLSRYTKEAGVVQEEKTKFPEVAVFSTEYTQELNLLIKNIAKFQLEDAELKAVIQRLSENPSAKICVKKGKGVYKLNNNVLYVEVDGIGGKLVIPEGKLEKVIWHYHKELGHAGTFKLIKMLSKKYYARTLRLTTKSLIKSCHECQLAKTNNCNTVGPCKPVIVKRVGEKLMADLYGPLPTGRGGCQYVFVVQEAFTKYVKLYAIKRATTRAVVRCIERFMESTKIYPECIVTDHGPQFNSKAWKDKIGELGIIPTYTSVYNPRPNSTERFHREMGNILRIYCQDSHTKWASVLNDIEQCHNYTAHHSHNYTPNFLMYGQNYRSKIENDNVLCDDPLPLDKLAEERIKAANNLIINAGRRSKCFDKNNKLIVYKIGQFVKLRAHPKSDSLKNESAKLMLRYSGPYIVTAIPYGNTYTLLDPNTNKIVGNHNAFNLERYYLTK